MSDKPATQDKDTATPKGRAATDIDFEKLEKEEAEAAAKGKGGELIMSFPLPSVDEKGKPKKLANGKPEMVEPDVLVTFSKFHTHNGVDFDEGDQALVTLAAARKLYKRDVIVRKKAA